MRRAELTEDLAGVGISVEMASHDVMLMLTGAQRISRELASVARRDQLTQVLEMSDRLLEVLALTIEGMRDVQSLFTAARRRRKKTQIEPLLDKIHRVYKPLLDRRNIRYCKRTKGNAPLVASTTDGVAMQVLINLFDNAAYWLEAVSQDAREIRITLDGNQSVLVFSDNGPGIDSADEPYIFDAFYSGKGEDGRGLGLYIARQLLERHDYRINVADASNRVLSGANFVVSFMKRDT